MATLTLNGVAVELSDAALPAVTALQTALTSATSTIAARDGALDALRSSHATELAAANSRVLDAAALDAAISERTSLLDAAKPMLPAGFSATGKSNADIRRAAVVAKLGDAKVTGKSDDYVGAAFDTLTATATAVEKKDPIVDALVTGTAAVTDAAKSPYEQYVADLLTSHLPKKG